jgi:hypothetical protein
MCFAVVVEKINPARALVLSLGDVGERDPLVMAGYFFRNTLAGCACTPSLGFFLGAFALGEP